MSAGDEDDRPFVCTASGCGMRFTNEDHLTVHKQKHEMSLALDVGMNRGLGGFVADQTPTPTKFLKNCEEIGLFQDLNKNPFDDAFKRATEAINSANEAGMPGPSSLDTPVLPSPFAARLQKFVVQERSPLANAKKVKNEVESPLNVAVADESTGRLTTAESVVGKPLSRKHTPPPLKIPAIRVTSPDQSSDTRTSPEEIFDMQDVVAMEEVNTPSDDDASDEMAANNLYILVNGHLIPLNSFVASPPEQTSTTVTIQSPTGGVPITGTVPVMSIHTTGSTVEATSTTSNIMKQRLKAVLTGTTTSESSLVPAGNGTHDLGVLSSVQSSSQQSSGATPSKRPRRGVEEDAETKRQHFLERNRAAAARCRNKRKMQIDQLEKRCTELSENNKRLQSEVANLKDEVANLKLLLLAHKDCPITRKQQEEGLFNLGDLKHVSITVSPASTSPPVAAPPKPLTISIPASEANTPIPQLLQKIQSFTAVSQQHPVQSKPQYPALRVALPATKVVDSGKFIRLAQPGTYILPAGTATLPIISQTTPFQSGKTNLRAVLPTGLIRAAAEDNSAVTTS